MSDIAQAAIGKWSGILSALGVPEEFLNGKHQPCLLCGGKDRARFDDKDGRGTYICGQCGSGDGLTLLMKLYNWDFKQAAKEVERIVGTVERAPAKPQPDPRIRLRAVQKAAAAAGAEVRAYLSNRGLKSVPPGLMQSVDNYYENGKKYDRYTVMLGKVVSPQGKPLTWHITYLQDGSKAPVNSPKKIMKAVSKINGAAIRLYPIADHIGIAEGIETAIAAQELMNVPTWSVMNTSGMQSFIAPNGIKKITVFADNDRNYAGQKAAYALANRLYLDGIEVNVLVPSFCGDWLDVLLSEKSA